MTEKIRTLAQAMKELGALGFRVPGKKTRARYKLDRLEDPEYVIMVRRRANQVDIRKIELATGKVENVGCGLGI